jgi:hypothetical protein
MAKYRNGFNVMWRTCGKVMTRCHVGKPGTFDKQNHHGGVMPGWPAESTMTDLRASKILHACIESRKLTIKQLDAVRKSLGFLWELTGNRTKKDSNWPCVGAQWDSTVRLTNLKPKKETPPMRIPTPKALRRAILKGWTKLCGMPLLKWLVFYSCFWDTMVCGARPVVDMDKIKKSRTHNFNYRQGWSCTDFLGGRSKLAGVKKGSRAWKVYKICLCKGKKHKRPRKDAWSLFDPDGNPTEEMGFDPVCPLACQEVVWQCQEEEDIPKRNYPNFIPRTKFYEARLGALNVGDPAQAAVEWLKVQGAGEFDHNAGRKSLAGWCHFLDVPYKLSVHIHGDLYEVWIFHYQILGLRKKDDKALKIREQSLDPQVATAALRKFAFFLGRGQVNEYKPPLSLTERQNNAILQHVAGKEVAKNVLMSAEAAMKKEEETDSDVESDNTPWRPPKGKTGARKRRRRKAPAVKEEPIEPMPKRKKVKKESPETKMKYAVSCRVRLKPLGRGNKFKLIGVTVS